MNSLLLNSTHTLVDHTGTTLEPEALLHRLENTAYCLTDSEGRFREVNRAYTELYGYSEAELIGNHFTMVVPQESRAYLAELHRQFIAGNDEIPAEYTVQKKDGTLIRIRVEAVRVEEEDDDSTGKLTIIDQVKA